MQTEQWRVWDKYKFTNRVWGWIIFAIVKEIEVWSDRIDWRQIKCLSRPSEEEQKKYFIF